MNLIIPFEGKVNFDYSVKEICSISLEHEYTLNDTSLLGNFLVEGTCKEHSLSINTTDFKFTVPFSVDLPENIDKESIELAIDNFTYNLEDKTLTLNIDYLVNANEMQEERKEIIIPQKAEDIKEDIDEEIEKFIKPEEQEISEDNRDISSNIIDFEDDYISYQIHIVTENDTIESIIKKYNCDEDIIYRLNSITNIIPGDKLIIPINND